METVFGLVKDPGAGMVHDLVRHFLAAVSWKAMEEHRIWLGRFEEIEIDPVRLKYSATFLGLGLLTHGGPYVGVYRVCASHGLTGVVGDHNLTESVGFGQ